MPAYSSYGNQPLPALYTTVPSAQSTYQPQFLQPAVHTPSWQRGGGSSGGGTLGGGRSLEDVYNAILNMPTTSTSTTTTNANRSPELDATLSNFKSMIESLSGKTQSAYDAKYNTYGDLINSLTNVYGAKGSTAMGAAQTGAIASGLTPLVAQQAGQTALQTMLADYFPALAGMKGEAADVGINAAKAQTDIQQLLALPLIEKVISPYYQAVAGSVSTTEADDPGKFANVLAQLAGYMSEERQANQSANTAIDVANINAAANRYGVDANTANEIMRDATARAGQANDITLQNMRDASSRYGVDANVMMNVLNAATTRRGQDVSSSTQITTQELQNVANRYGVDANTAMHILTDMTTRRGQDIGRESDMTRQYIDYYNAETNRQSADLGTRRQNWEEGGGNRTNVLTALVPILNNLPLDQQQFILRSLGVDLGSGATSGSTGTTGNRASGAVLYL